MSRFAVFGIGAFGGAAPTLLRLAMDLVGQHADSVVVLGRVGFYIGVVLLACLGGGIAAIWNEADPKKTFYIGLGLPSLLLVATQNYSQMGPRSQQAPVSKTSWLRQIEPTVAQAQNRPILDRYMEIQFPSEVGLFSTTFIPAVGNISVARFITRDMPIRVPANAIKVKIEGGNAESDLIALPDSPASVMKLKFRLQKNNWFGVRYAVGLSGRPFDLVLEEPPQVLQSEYVLEWQSFSMKGGLQKSGDSWHFSLTLNDRLVCALDGWQPNSVESRTLDLRQPASVCQTVDLPPSVPIGLRADVDSDPTHRESHGKVDLAQPIQAGPVSLDIRGDAYFVLQGQIRKR